MRGVVWAAILSTVGLAITGCAGQMGDTAAYSGSSGYPSTDGGYGATQQSTCGALGTCPATGLPQISPEDEHGQ